MAFRDFSNYSLPVSPLQSSPSPTRSPIPASGSSSQRFIPRGTVGDPLSQHPARGAPAGHPIQARPRRSYVASSVPQMPTGVDESSPDVDVKHYWGGTPALNPIVLNPSPSSSTLPYGWVRFCHLDGSFYYLNVMTGIVTTADIFQPETFAQLNAALPKMTRQLNQVPIHLSTKHVIVIEELAHKDGPTIYTLDYENCRYMRLVETDGVQQVQVEERTEKFWSALEAYPMHLQSIPMDIEVDFLGALSFGASERILEWNETSFPFTDEQTRRLVQIYRELKTAWDKGAAVAPALSWHIARTMTQIEQARQKAKFGTPDFRLYRDVVAEDVGWKVKLADACLLFVLFGAHRMYRARLQGARVKGAVYLADFRELLKNFLAEWSDSNLLATVFVGANIAFLAVPDITSLQQTASLASTVFSVLSVATGVYHTWQHRAKVDANYEEACNYMSRFQSRDAGGGRDGDLALTACALAVPLVALLYAVASFAVALGTFCVQNTGAHARVLLAVVLGVLGAAGLGTVLFFWHVWRGPRTEEVGEEDVLDVVAYGWRTRARKLRVQVGAVVGGWTRVAKRTFMPTREDDSGSQKV